MQNIVTYILLLLIYSDAFGQKCISAEWIYIYYMPYDNDLSPLGKDIISMIKDGITSDEVVAVIQADFKDDSGMYRYVISQEEGIIKFPVHAENSANTNSYEQYLNWVTENFQFRKSAVIFLNHGGKLDELCLDEYPRRSYLKVDSVRTSLEKFNKLQAKKIDLLFLQVCTKGSIEPLFEFNNVARYTLSSQSILYAPNCYYQNLFNDVSNCLVESGLDVAKLICEYEEENMYRSYTCINNSKFEEFKIMFNYFIAEIQKDEKIILKFEPISYSYANEYYWDLISFLSNIELIEQNKIRIRDELLEFIRHELISIYKKNPQKIWVSNYSGLSITSPQRDGSLKSEKYKHLLFFKEFKVNNAKFYIK